MGNAAMGAPARTDATLLRRVEALKGVKARTASAGGGNSFVATEERARCRLLSPEYLWEARPRQ